MKSLPDPTCMNIITAIKRMTCANALLKTSEHAPNSNSECCFETLDWVTANSWAVRDSAWRHQMNEMGSQWHQCLHHPGTAHTLATSPGIVLHLEEPRAQCTNIRSDSSTEESSEYLRSRKHWL